jgi:hypothetical protein
VREPCAWVTQQELEELSTILMTLNRLRDAIAAMSCWVDFDSMVIYDEGGDILGRFADDLDRFVFVPSGMEGP